MGRAIGLGGIFFKAENPRSLSHWYAKHLGLSNGKSPGSVLPTSELPPDAFSIWAPFREASDYFSPSSHEFMVNFLVDDLDACLLQVQAGGARLCGEIQQHDYGRFAWFMDPEGNKVELWELRRGPSHER